MSARALTPCKYSIQPGRYCFRLDAELQVFLSLGHTGRHIFADRGKVWAELVDDVLTIFPGYASDGASPHFFTIGKLRVGTPSHAKIAPAWFAHDALYQFGRLPCAPWSFRQADGVLYQLMREAGSVLAAPYWAAVAAFGGIHRRLTASPSTGLACFVPHHRYRGYFVRTP